MLTRMKILTRLLVGFSLILAATLFIGIIGARSIDQLAEITANIFRHPFTVTNTILEVKAELLINQRLITQLVHNGNPADLPQYEQDLAERITRVNRKMALVRERFLGNPADVDDIEQGLARWRVARTETLELMRKGRIAEAIAQNDGRDAEIGEGVFKEVEDVATFAFNKAASFKELAEAESRAAVRTIVLAIVLVLAAGIGITVAITRSVSLSLSRAAREVERVVEGSSDKARVAEAIGAGDLSQEIIPTPPLQVDVRSLPDDELGALFRAAARLGDSQAILDEAFRKMTRSLRRGREAEQAADWLKSGLNELYSRLRGEQDLKELANAALSYLVEYLGAGVGALYVRDEGGDELQLAATYACPADRLPGQRLRLGEGLAGEAARKRRILSRADLPADYLPITSALGGTGPLLVVAAPLVQGPHLVGALEIATSRDFSPVEREFLDLAREAIAISLRVSASRQRLSELLEETQHQAEELRVQQEELQQSNEELEERAQMLEEQRESIRAKNAEIEQASETLRQKAAELERVSTYKSQFLANMSHELRTPLNSLMILSSLLMQNREGNLSAKQVEYVGTIHAAGRDLLDLINDILDLSKVEAGHMSFQRSEVELADLCDSLHALFTPFAEKKGLELSIEADAAVPATIQGDEQRILQILRNLLANAVKFTEQGQVGLHVTVPPAGDNPLPVPALAFAVSDTGIGIAPSQQQVIFEAFQQADGSISRKYGGTGLGLSISLQLARRMGGEIRLHSLEGEGSVFTLYLPSEAPALGEEQAPAAARLPPPLPARPPEALPAPPAAPALAGMIRARGFPVLAAGDGESGIALAERYLPSAIILDVMLPRINGWGVMASLKDNPATRHIPVHFITCLEDRQKAMAMGAIGFLTKPVALDQLDGAFGAIEASLAKGTKKLLIVEDNAREAGSMVALLEEKDVDITVAASGREAMDLLAGDSFDCLILDLALGDMSGFELLAHIQCLDQARRLPVIIHSGRELTAEEERRLRRHAESIIIKGARSPERLLNEVSLFLHLVESRLHPSKQRMIRSAVDKEAVLDGRKVLLVDDDLRNIFSLSSVLEERNMVVIEAENGREALARLEEHPDVGLVLMDVMMPEMDGYTAMGRIRQDPRFADLPVIAMTAKALKGDYEKCIAAGASDYIAKPIDVDKLLSLLRVWLYQFA